MSLRLALIAADFLPIPLNGKAPVLKQWQHGSADVESWAKLYPFATNTGIVTRLAPALDIDILDPGAADAVEALVREKISDGAVLIRTGRAPKRLIPFRTERPFAKITIKLITPLGAVEKLEFLGAGQQYVGFGTHPDTGRPYVWHGGEPGKVHRSALPEIDGEGAKRLIEEAVDLLVARFGYGRLERNGVYLRGGGNGQSVLVADLTAALQAMDSIEWRGDHERWFELLMGCKFVGVSLDAFTAWCIRDPNYADDADQIARWWRSVEPRHGGAFYSALKDRGIRICPMPTSAVHLTPLMPKSARSVGARLNGVCDGFRRDPEQTEPRLFSWSCLLAEVLLECDLGPLSKYRGLLESAAIGTPLWTTLGAEGVRRTITRAFAHVEAKGERHEQADR
jgi:hypothetical protein